MTILLNGLHAVSVRLLQPWQGAWIADVDFDLAQVPVVPVGPCTLTIGTTVLQGTIDPEASGAFGDKAKARVIGGAGGWHKTVFPLHFHNDAGLFTTNVITATAAEVLERVTVLIPKRLGTDFLRLGGPASRVLAGLDWYVDFTGVTIVGPRPPIPMSTEISILSWDPKDQRAELASDSIISPGTILVDPRFGTETIRDIEQTFSEGKARATAWCSGTGSKGSKISTLFKALVNEHGSLATLRPYRYRIVLQGADGRLTLQAIAPTVGIPDCIDLPIWPGLPGVTMKVVPGGECMVQFLDGDLSQPVVTSFKGEVLELKVGTGFSPVALADAVEANLNGLKAAIAAATITPADGGASLKASLLAALSSWPLTMASTKLKSD